MKKNLQKVLAKGLAATMACTMVFGFSPAKSADAAAKKPKLSATKATVSVGKTKKITVKGVKAKKIKKTTWSVKSKKIAKITKKAKTSVTIKGVKAGKTKVTAKIKVGKKVTTKSCTVTVKKATKKVTVVPATTVPAPTAPATAVPTVQPTAVPPTATPTLRPLTKVSMAPVTTSDPEKMATTVPAPTANPLTAETFHADFNSCAVGEKTEGGDATTTIDGVSLRLPVDPTNHDTDSRKNDYIVVEADGYTGNCLRVNRGGSGGNAQGALIQLTNSTEAGGMYTFSFWAKVDAKGKALSSSNTIVFSQQLKATESLKEGYANLLTKTATEEWQKFTYDFTIPDDMFTYGIYIETFNSAGMDILVDDISLVQKNKVRTDETIPSLKDAYSTIFNRFGVGAGSDSLMGDRGCGFIKSQFNALTLGNDMKPDAILGDRKLISVDEAKELGYVIPDSYLAQEENKSGANVVVPKLNFDNIDLFLARCKEQNIKLRAHTLVWHQQTPVFFFQQNYKTAQGAKYNVSKETMDSRLEFYIRTVMEHVFKTGNGDCIYAWDVVNEYLHSDNETSGKPTYYDEIYGTINGKKITTTPSFVKLAFQIANDELVKNNREDISLFYNDYNEYDVKEDIIRLTDFINDYDGKTAKNKICDGIGLQAHMDMKNPSIDTYNNTLEYLSINAPYLELQVTELDIMKTNGYKSNDDILKDPTCLASEQELAAKYKDIVRTVVECQKRHNNITAFILWSLYDGVSWRPAAEPCIFSGIYDAKGAFWELHKLASEYTAK